MELHRLFTCKRCSRLRKVNTHVLSHVGLRDEQTRIPKSWFLIQTCRALHYFGVPVNMSLLM